MSLTIDNNRLAQQQALPTQSTPAQTTAPATAAPAAAPAAATNPSAALISGNAGLTSDLLSVLLQDQSSNTGTSSASSGPVTLAGVLDAEDQVQSSQSQTDSFTGLDPASAAQSATSTDSFMNGLQDLLDRLAQMPV